MTEEDIEAVRRTCFELWGLEDPDVIEAFHAWRIIQIKLGRTIEPSFADFVVSWKKYTAK